MTTSVTFDNATLSEAVKRLAIIAPKKGEARDKADGIVLDIHPGEAWVANARVTNLSVYYDEWINTIEATGPAAKWRLNAILFSGIIGKLPIGRGKTTTLTQDRGSLLITSGRTKAKLMLISTEYYPQWPPFDPASLSGVHELGLRIEQTSWAAQASEGSILSGIRFDGKTIASTDRYRLARVPCVIPSITEPVIVPAKILGPIIRQMGGETKVGVVDEKFAIMPNPYTQITCAILGGKYPNVDGVMEKNSQHPNSITVNKEQLIATIDRVSVIGRGERVLVTKMWIGKSELAFMHEDGQGRDHIGDVIELDGQCQHERMQAAINPMFFVEALAQCPTDNIKISYDASNPVVPLHVYGGETYEAWVVPLSDEVIRQQQQEASAITVVSEGAQQ